MRQVVETNASIIPLSSKRVVNVALLLALGVVVTTIERLVTPSLPVPGFRLGLGNIAVLLALPLLGPVDAFIVGVFRPILAGMVTGSIGNPVFVLSVVGGFSATVVMVGLWSVTRRTSLIGVSVVGAVTHNVVQLLVAAAMLQTGAIVSYLPVALLLAASFGSVTGMVANVAAQMVYFRVHENHGPMVES